MPNIHPILVHFPIALLTTSLLFDLVGALMKRDDVTRTAWWCQIAGSLGVLGTVFSGLLAEMTIMIPAAARESFETHKEVAFLVATIFAVLLLWRISSRTRIPHTYRFIFWGLYILGVVLIWIGAWHGGEMVYRFGMGVHTLMPS